MFSILQNFITKTVSVFLFCELLKDKDRNCTPVPGKELKTEAVLKAEYSTGVA